MKKILILFFLFLCADYMFAQDVIVKKDGSTILSKVLEVNPSNVKYKKSSNLNGPTYSIDISDLLSINYENGDKDCFATTTLPDSSNKTSTKNGYIAAYPDSSNMKLIEMMNSMPDNNDKKKNRKTKASMVAAFMGIEAGSTLSSSEAEIVFCRDYIELSSQKGEYCYNIKIRNKTNEILYIDKSSCFIVDNAGNAYQFYSPNETSKSSGNNVGMGLSLASVTSLLNIKGTIGTIMNSLNLNGGFSNYTTITEKNQQILTVPPHASIFIAKGLKIPLFYIEKNLLCMGECKSFNYSDSPMSWSYFITYSQQKDFKTYSTLNIKAYCKYLYGYMGFPIAGGNLVKSPISIYPNQIFSVFNCRSAEATKYNIWKPN